ncbi:MAG: hypothetical protein PWP23_665 [Candidatus Sumerlaeota bacterium]|nr:hypothetical protein [Candidatus Sumerlaeota bacterium]
MPDKKTDIRFRPATPADIPAIVKMIHELAVYERAPEECHATEANTARELFGAKPHAEALIAEVNGQPAGYAIFFHNYSTWEAAPGLYLEDVYVRPTFRRRGLGRMFLTTLAAIARERGCHRFEWSVLDWNKPARDFYEQMGARPMTEWVIYRTDGDALDEMADEGRKLLDTLTAAPPPPKASSEEAGGKYVIHTDGGAQPNPGTGAWAAVVRHGKRVTELTDGERETTNNRMEMTAAIRALESLPGEGCSAEVHTDSEYLRNGITKWIRNWKKNGWKTAGKTPVKNADLWQRLDELCQRHSVAWHWLKGHAGHEDNERCDVLCTETIARLLRQK